MKNGLDLVEYVNMYVWRQRKESDWIAREEAREINM